MHRNTRTAVAGGVALFLLAAPAAAVGEEGSQRLPPIAILDREIIGSPAAQTRPAIAWNDADNEYLVVWEDDRNWGPRGLDIYGRRVDSGGYAIGTAFRISGPQALMDEYEPAVAWNQTANRYLVVWRDGRDRTAKGDEIFGRVLAADGTPVGGDHRISGPKATMNEYQPDIVWNQTEKEFLVVWIDGRNVGPRGFDIYGRLVGADGKPAGGERRVSGPRADADEASPAVAWDQTSNRYLVVWDDTRAPVARGGDIYSRLLDAGGKPIGGDHRISGPKATSDDNDPDLAWFPSQGRYLAVWKDERNDGTTGDDIYGRLVGADGRPAGGDHRMSGPAAVANEYRPAVACHPTAGRCLVVWDDTRDLTHRGSDVFGRYVGANGKAVGSETRASGTAATSNDAAAALACSQTDNRYQVVWQDFRNSGYPGYHGWDIYGRRLPG